MILAEDIGITRGGKQLLNRVNLRLRPGRLLAVLGPNGAGKSTLLKVLSGAVRPDRGKVELNGRPLADWHPEALARQRGVLSQKINLSFPMSVREVVALGRYASKRGERSEQRHRITDWALRQTDMAAYADRDMLTLSGGEQQRVHLARVLAQIYTDTPEEPGYLLLDEPVASLDIAQQFRLLDLMHHLTRNHPIGAIVIIHDLHLAARYADTLLLMRAGRVVDSGPPERLMLPDTIESVFGIRLDVPLPQRSTFQNL